MSAKKTQGSSTPRKTTRAKKSASEQAVKGSTDAAAKKTAPSTTTASRKTTAAVKDAKAQTPETPVALTESHTPTPAKAASVSLAVKEAKPPVVREEAMAPAIKEAKAPVIKEEAKAPAIKEVHVPALQPDAQEKEVENMAEMQEKQPVPTKKFTPANLGPNPYLPHVSTVMEVIEETHNIKTFRVVFDDVEAMKAFSFQAGQVGQLSLFGAGESTFVINSPPSQKEYLQFSVMRTGEVTDALHKLSAGDKVGVRGPLGNAFPCENWKGKDVFFVGGGIGMAPIRTIMLHVLENKADYGKVSLLYGARSPRDMAFSYELEGWLANKDLDCTLTIDNPFDGWEHKVGLIPNVLKDLAPDPHNTIAVLCGPPIMIHFTIKALDEMQFPSDHIITTLEKRMKCGIGICGRCNIGSKYVCVDGPVFSRTELNELPPEL